MTGDPGRTARPVDQGGRRPASRRATRSARSQGALPSAPGRLQGPEDRRVRCGSAAHVLRQSSTIQIGSRDQHMTSPTASLDARVLRSEWRQGGRRRLPSHARNSRGRSVAARLHHRHVGRHRQLRLRRAGRQGARAASACSDCCCPERDSSGFSTRRGQAARRASGDRVRDSRHRARRSRRSVAIAGATKPSAASFRSTAKAGRTRS